MQAAVTRTVRFARGPRPISVSRFITTNTCRKMAVASSRFDTKHKGDALLEDTKRKKKNGSKPLVLTELLTKPASKEPDVKGKESSEEPFPRFRSKKFRKQRRKSSIAHGNRPLELGSPTSQIQVVDGSAASTSIDLSTNEPLVTESGSYDDEDQATRALWLQAPHPPIPPSQHYPLYRDAGISAKAAAIGYLRTNGLANHRPAEKFYHLLSWVLRHVARRFGFGVAPDGFIRILDLLQFEPFQSHNIESFASRVIRDKYDRFEVARLPDYIDGELKDIWWVRARASHSMPGVLASNRRILNMGRLQTVAYRATMQDWQSIKKYGIREGPTGLIPLHQIGQHHLSSTIPEQMKYICITIDAQKAADMGVMFFHTSEADLFAVGRNGVIPVQAIRSVVELELTRTTLL